MAQICVIIQKWIITPVVPALQNFCRVVGGGWVYETFVEVSLFLDPLAMTACAASSVLPEPKPALAAARSRVWPASIKEIFPELAFSFGLPARPFNRSATASAMATRSLVGGWRFTSHRFNPRSADLTGGSRKKSDTSKGGHNLPTLCPVAGKKSGNCTRRDRCRKNFPDLRHTRPGASSAHF
jgi:hypothetical protein